MTDKAGALQAVRWLGQWSIPLCWDGSKDALQPKMWMSGIVVGMTIKNKVTRCQPPAWRAEPEHTLLVQCSAHETQQKGSKVQQGWEGRL